MINKGLFSSLSQKWRTPNDLYRILDKEFKFDYDPCPSNPKKDGLIGEWGKSNFVNPPYKNIKLWVEKAFVEYKKGKTVVMLIPSRTDTKWWHNYVMKAKEIRFIKGRVKFIGVKNSGPAPFPSAIIIFSK